MGLKLLLLFASVIAGTMTGFALFKRADRKEKYFESLIKLCDRLISDIRFSQNSVSVILKNFLTENKTALNTNVDEYLAYINTKDAVLSISKNGLKETEYMYVKSFFENLGTSDSSTQLLELENAKSKFTGFYEDVQKRNKSYSKNYIKLGFLFGLALGIILL